MRGLLGRPPRGGCRGGRSGGSRPGVSELGLELRHVRSGAGELAGFSAAQLHERLLLAGEASLGAREAVALAEHCDRELLLVDLE